MGKAMRRILKVECSHAVPPTEPRELHEIQGRSDNPFSNRRSSRAPTTGAITWHAR